MPIPYPEPFVEPPIDEPPTQEEIRANPRSVITWTSSDTGETLILTGDISGDQAGVVVQPGLNGFDAPPVELVLDELPAVDGSLFRHQRSPTREMMLPLFVWAPTRPELVRLKRQLINHMMNGYGVLRVTEADGSYRQIRCYYSSGMEGAYGDGEGFVWQRYGPVVRAPDPFWYGPLQEVTLNLSPAAPINFFTGKVRGSVGENTGPFMVPGIHLSSTYIPPGGITLATTGDVDSWPIWTITGKSATAFTLWNKTSDKKLTLVHDFALAGDTVTIDTRPGFKTVESARDGNIWPKLGTNPQLWPVLAGANLIEITLSGTDPGITGSAKLTYEPRFRVV